MDIWFEKVKSQSQFFYGQVSPSKTIFMVILLYFMEKKKHIDIFRFDAYNIHIEKFRCEVLIWKVI